jgi:hypothetical protein
MDGGLDVSRPKQPGGRLGDDHGRDGGDADPDPFGR